MVELKRNTEERIIPASEMETGQLGEIVLFDDCIDGTIVQKFHGMIAEVGGELIWNQSYFDTMKVRLLEKGDTIVITEN